MNSPALLERVRDALPPDAEISEWSSGVIVVSSRTLDIGAASLLLERREWAPGRTTSPFPDEQWHGEWTRSPRRYSGAGWLKRLAQAAWRALLRAANP